jgi:hypothetical protein
MRIEIVDLSREDLEFVLDSGVLPLTTREGSRVVFYQSGTPRPENVPAVPVSADGLLVQELRTGGKSGYTHGEHPFVLDIRLTD